MVYMNGILQRYILSLNSPNLFYHCLYSRQIVDRMPANGPAIKGVCVAERMQAGAEDPNQGTVLAPAGMNEAWCGFWRHGTNFRVCTRVAVQV